jgi:hypothetical protein
LFAGTGAIGRYWQARSVGFEVRSVQGRRLGVVTRVGLNPESRRVHALYVARLHRADAIVIDPTFVVSVDPWERMLIVEQPDEERAVAEAPTVVKALPAVAVRAAPVAWHRAVPVGVAAAQHVGAAAQHAGSAARSCASPLRRGASWLGKRLAYAAAFLVWLYGAAVYALARATARVLLVFAAALAGVTRWVAPRLWGSTKKAAGRARDFGARHSVSSR